MLEIIEKKSLNQNLMGKLDQYYSTCLSAKLIRRNKAVFLEYRKVNCMTSEVFYLPLESVKFWENNTYLYEFDLDPSMDLLFFI